MRANRFPVHWLGRSAMIFAILIVFVPWTPGAGAGTDPKLGGGGTVATGSAGGAESQGASSQLERCDESLGTIAVVEDQSAAWYHTLSQYKLGSTVPVLRMMIQQSNCFVVVERGAAGGYTNTPEGKILTAAFMDSYNKLVNATRNYQAQSVKGGLGTGGRLGVQGGSTPASKELPGK